MITREEIEANIIYQFSGEISNDNAKVVYDWISENIENKKERRYIGYITVCIIQAFNVNEENFEFLLSKEQHIYHIYLSTFTSQKVAKFLEKFTVRHNLKSIYELRDTYRKILTSSKMSVKSTVGDWISWWFIETGIKVNEQVQFNYVEINSEKSKIEFIIPVNVNRLWEFRLYNSSLNLSKEIIGKILNWHEGNNNKYSELMEQAIDKVKNDISKIGLLTDEVFLEELRGLNN